LPTIKTKVGVVQFVTLSIINESKIKVNLMKNIGIKYEEIQRD